MTRTLVVTFAHLIHSGGAADSVYHFDRSKVKGLSSTGKYRIPLFLLCFTLGCGGNSGPPTAHWRGQVLLDGKPLPATAEASITFQPQMKGQGRTASIQVVDSKYDSPQTPMGKVLVYIDVQIPTGKLISDAGGTPFPEFKNVVSPPYNQGLDVDVSGDNLQRDFDLK